MFSLLIWLGWAVNCWMKHNPTLLCRHHNYYNPWGVDWRYPWYGQTFIYDQKCVQQDNLPSIVYQMMQPVWQFPEFYRKMFFLFPLWRIGKTGLQMTVLDSAHQEDSIKTPILYRILLMSRIQNCNFWSNFTWRGWGKHLVAKFRKSLDRPHYLIQNRR